MPTYKIKVKEVHIAEYVVTAINEKSAIRNHALNEPVTTAYHDCLEVLEVIGAN